MIISPNTGSVNGMLLGQALDWILAENDRADSELFQKLDAAHVGMGGHSLGSVSTFDREGGAFCQGIWVSETKNW